MRRMLSGFNANSILLMIASAVLIYMNSKVLDATYRLPVIEQQINSFQVELNIMREELKREERDRKEADQENRSRLKMIEDREARRP